MRRRSLPLDSVDANILQGSEDDVNTMLEFNFRFPDRTAKLTLCLHSDQKSVSVLSVLKMCRAFKTALMCAIADSFDDWTYDGTAVRLNNAFASGRVHQVTVDVYDDGKCVFWGAFFPKQ